MKRIINLIILCAALALAVGCTGSGNGSGAKHVPQPSDTLYTEQKAMSIHRTVPERALLMIDSAVTVGNIAPQRGEYLKALTQYAGMHNYPLARQICLDLLEDEETPADSATRQQTWSLLATVEYVSGNFPGVIRYATEASRMAHALDMPGEVGTMESYIAQAMAQTGRPDEGVERLRNVVGKLRQVNTFKVSKDFQNTSKRLLHILIEHERLTEAIPVCEAMLERLDELQSHPEHFSDLKEDGVPADYLDFCRGQTFAFLTAIYARLATNNAGNPALRRQYLAKGLEAEAAALRTQWSHSLDCDKMMIGAYHHLGQFDRFDQAMDRIDAAIKERGDTINYNYFIGLEQRSRASEMRGRYADALHYHQRAFNVHDSLDYRNQRDQLNELATVYHLQEEQLARKEKEAEARFFRWISVVIIIALIIAIAFAVYFFHKRRETARKNRALVRMIDEMHRQVEAKGPASSAANTKQADVALFSRFTALIHDEQLYRDIALDRDAVCQRLGIDRHVLNQLLNTYADGLSLPAYINRVRIDVAYELLRDEPGKSIADIADIVGFTPQNLRLQFKKRYGITPTEYRQNR